MSFTYTAERIFSNIGAARLDGKTERQQVLQGNRERKKFSAQLS